MRSTCCAFSRLQANFARALYLTLLDLAETYSL